MLVQSTMWLKECCTQRGQNPVLQLIYKTFLEKSGRIFLSEFFYLGIFRHTNLRDAKNTPLSEIIIRDFLIDKKQNRYEI